MHRSSCSLEHKFSALLCMDSFCLAKQCPVLHRSRLCSSAEHATCKVTFCRIWELYITAAAAVQITYDIYKPYFHKNASSKELLLVSRVAVAFFGLVMACVSVIFYKVCQMLPPFPAQFLTLRPALSQTQVALPFLQHQVALPVADLSCTALLYIQIVLACCKITLRHSHSHSALSLADICSHPCNRVATEAYPSP